MFSDFDNIEYDKEIDKIFINDTTQPFEPFQSLIFILPKTSFNLLPSCYSSIPEEYPDLFPVDFKIDYNGKRTPWESITLLPFLDEKFVIDLEKKKRKLTPYEEKLDSWGESYIYYPNEVGSSDIKKEKYEIYQKIDVLLSSNYKTKKIDYSFPSLKTIDFDYNLESSKVYYGKNSKKTKKIIIYPVKNEKITQQTIENYLINKSIFVNYPYKSFGKLIGFIYNQEYYYIYQGKMYIDSNFKLFGDLTDKISNDLYKKGLYINYPDILCNVALFDSFGTNKQGKIVRIYDEQNAFYVPYEITSLNSCCVDFAEYKKKFNYTLGLEKIESKNLEGNDFIRGSVPVNIQENTEDQKENRREGFPLYKTKRIITKTVPVDKKFKTYPEGIELNSKTEKINFEKSVKNVSEYRENRLFQNEKIGFNQLYYFSSEENCLSQNKNVIFQSLK